MGPLEMTKTEREEFLAGLHVGILSVEDPGHAPLAVPMWYAVVEGEVLFHTGGSSRKARLLQRAGRATLTVQTETPPYQYVSVQGPVTIRRERRPDHDRLFALRYLGPKLGARYAERNPPGPDDVLVHLRPERWSTTDFGKLSTR
ncbi:MAG TPA: pyridoxamine 5'-phosphate oxidase family protein [Candidatus Dormibacteraeota bacterium]|nr:pyridoxamine 5'-phosphate oxidase family protein [Candidatus Dormibacteraeota bacterium]